MKRYIFIMAALATACMVQARDANQMKYVSILPSITTTNASTTGGIIDIAAYKGNATLVVLTGTASATNNTRTVTLQHSTAANFASPATVTNILGNAAVVTAPALTATTQSAIVQTYPIDLGRLRRYVRVVTTQTLADQSIPVGVVLVAPMKSE
jgi:hypothetical protein